jgi:phospholipase/carboxylesterase
VKIDPSQVLWSAPESDRVGRPLLVVLHGHNSNESVGFDLRHRMPPDLVIASVRAPMQASAGFAWFRLDPQVAVQQANTAARGVLEWLAGQPAAPSVGILGVSQGAATGLQALRLAPEVFDYGVVLSGFVVPGVLSTDQQLLASPPPVFWGLGDRDGVIPDFLVTLSRTWLARHTRLDERVYPGLGHNVADAELTDLSNFLQAQVERRAS